MNIHWKAFTLIELLVVIAIIAILAAIAVVNLLEAQTRSKVTRAKADMRTFFVGLEAYRVDQNSYPRPNTVDAKGKTFLNKVFELTTPIAYLSSVNVIDPFKPIWTAFEPGTSEPVGWEPGYSYFNYSSRGFWGQNITKPSWPDRYSSFEGCCIESVGPDRDQDGLHWLPSLVPVGKGWYGVNFIYDPTNGTSSSGDIVRWTGQPSHYNAF